MRRVGATASPTITSPRDDDWRRHDAWHGRLHESGASAGQTVDKRGDIWAFGCVLYEMLTGRRAFEGDDISPRRWPPSCEGPGLECLASAAPLELRRLLTRCLRKDPKARLHDIGEARVQITN